MQPELQLQFDFEWQDPADARGEELRATWASLSIRLNDTHVTELLDRRSRSVRTRIFLPLYPLAEWLATNWWYLKSETERPENNSRAFDRRHNLRWAREGFALPSLRLVTLGSHFEAQWSSLDIPDAGIKFLASGQALLPAVEINRSLNNFLNAVVTRLDDMDVHGTTLQEEWAAVQGSSREEQEFCNASARLSVDPYSISESLEAKIVKVAGIVRAELLDDFLSVTSVDNLLRHATLIKEGTDSISSDVDHVDALADIRKRIPQIVATDNPWEVGYQFASKLRENLGGGHWKSHSMDELAGHLRIDQLDHCLLQGSEGCQFVDALVGTNQHNNPKFFVQKKRPDSRQFAFCRALFEHLTLKTGAFAAVSRLRTERQQMNRAFAAEFLAPYDLLKNDLSGTSISEDEVDDLAQAYGVSAFVVRHQIENHRLARVST